MADLLPFRPPADDPNGSGVRAVLSSHYALERVKSMRQAFLVLVCASSVVVVAALLWASPPSALRTIGLEGWSMSLAALLVSGSLEWRLRRRRDALLARIERTARER